MKSASGSRVIFAAMTSIFVSFLVLAILWIPTGVRAANNACTLLTDTVTENFTGAVYGPSSTWDSAGSNIDGWGQGHGIYAGLRSGAFPSNAQTPQIVQLGRRVRSGSSGMLAARPTYSRPFAMLSDDAGCKVWMQKFSNIDGFDTVPSRLDKLVLVDDSADCRPGAVLAAVPYSEIGFFDRGSLVVLSPTNSVFEGTLNSATLYRSNSNETWDKLDFTAITKAAGLSIHGGSPMAFKDIDGDGRADLLVASSSGSVNQLLVFYADPISVENWTFSSFEILVPDLGFIGPFANASQPAQAGPACASSSSMVSRGVTGMDTGDFDGDGLTDIIVSSASEPNLHVFLGTSRNTFVRGFDVVTPNAAGITYVFAEDFNGDTKDDILLVQDGRGCGGNPAQAQVLYATAPGVFGSSSVPLFADTVEIDWASKQRATVDNPQGQDPTIHQDAVWNAFLGNSDTLGSFKWWYNMPNGSYYTPYALARSVVRDTATGSKGNLATTRVTNLRQSTPSGTTLTYYVTANAGDTWELLTPAELNGQPHPFASIGTEFSWQATFTGAKKNQTGKDAGYSQAATATAQIGGIAFENAWASARQFSRSSPAYGTVMVGGVPTEYVYASAFDLPSFKGHLTAQSLAGQTSASPGALQLIEVNASWDAGSLLQSATEAGRKVITSQQTAAMKSAVDNTMAYSERPIDFTTAQLDSTSNTPTLALQLRLPSKRATSLLAALRSGVSGTSFNVLRGTGHGSPVFVGPPNQDASVLGNNYANFVSAQKDRDPFVLLGANDGMLHAFNAKTGAEMWAVVPSNLLSILNREIGYDDSGNVFGRHIGSVDGPISVSDVYTSAKGWRTVAIVGQGDGTAADGRNFYFAVDVTSPTTPVWLWEMTQSPSGLGGGCDPDPCSQISCTYTCETSTTGCKKQNAAFDAEMSLRATQLDGINAYGLLEAEHYTSEMQGLLPTSTDWVEVADGSTAAKFARNKAFMQPSSSSGSCNQTSLHNAYQSCAQISYRINAANAFSTVYPQFLVYQGGGTHLSYTLDNKTFWSGALTKLGTASNNWQWMTGGTLFVSAGLHTLTVFMNDSALAIDAVALTSRQAALSVAAVETPTTRCPQTCSSNGCKTTCLTSPSTQEWPSCGVGNKQKCCDAGNGRGYCVAMGGSCSGSFASMGRAYSSPAIGRIATSLGNKWVAFFGSGNASDDSLPTQGTSLYMVDAMTGQPMASWGVSSVAAPSATPTQLPAVQAGPTLVDVDGDGNVDRVYFADLAGRVWKLNTQATANVASSGAMSSPGQYATCLKFDAGDPQQTGSRQWAPIYQPPKAIIVARGSANIYFGAGVLPNVTSTLPSTFYSLRDSDAMTACSSGARKLSSFTTANAEWSVSEPASKRRNFSEAVVVGGTGVYFTSYDASADSTNVCAATVTGSNVYALAAKNFTGSGGISYRAGKSLLSGGTPYLATSATLRSAGIARSAVASQVVRANTGLLDATDVLLQQLTGETARITTPQQVVTRSRLQPTRFRTIQPQ